jgi:hypothetical protein
MLRVDPSAPESFLDAGKICTALHERIRGEFDSPESGKIT